MSQIVQRSVASNLVASVLHTDGTPVTGLIYSDITCLYRKEGQGSFTSKTITSLNWTELGNGIYTVGFTTTELNTVGSFVFLIQSSGNAQSVTIVDIQEVIQGPVGINQCLVTGHISDLSGNPIENAAVSVHILALPTILGNVGITSSLIAAKTDMNGQFFISLAQTATVELFIPILNFTKSFQVPALSSVDIFTGV